MGRDDLRQKLIHSRFLQNEEQVQEFEESIEKILSLNSVDCIRDLCLGFEDGAEDDEVMFGLVHAIEAFNMDYGLEVSLTRLAEAVPCMLPHAREWAKTLHKRILNHDETRKVYLAVMYNIDQSTRDIVIALMNEIKVKNPDRFAKKTEEFLSMIKSPR